MVHNKAFDLDGSRICTESGDELKDTLLIGRSIRISELRGYRCKGEFWFYWTSWCKVFTAIIFNVYIVLFCLLFHEYERTMTSMHTLQARINITSECANISGTGHIGCIHL
jgi:hypothetical protein